MPVSGGDYQWRPDGERHLFNPLTVHYLQAACAARDGEVWTNGYKTFKQYSPLVNAQEEELLRCAGCSNFVWADNPIPLDEVEPVERDCQAL